MTSPKSAYRFIRLSNSPRRVTVSPEDYDSLSEYVWHGAKPAKNRPIYARRTVREGDICYGVWMHRQILGLRRGDSKWGDHKNNKKTLDNRRSNLRVVTPSQNNMNRSGGATKGVSWSAAAQKWRARIKVNKKEIHLGVFSSKRAALAVRRIAAKKYHGEFARTL